MTSTNPTVMRERGQLAGPGVAANDPVLPHMRPSKLPVIEMEWLEAFNAAKNPIWVMSFVPNKACYVWANRECELSHGKTVKELQDQDLESDASQGVRKRHAIFYDMVQCQEQPVGPTITTIYPNGKPVTYDLMMTPIRVRWKGIPQTVVLVNGNLKDRDSTFQGELQRAMEMQRHSKALVMLFKCSDGSMLAYSPSAYTFYTRYAYFNRESSAVSFKDQTLASIMRFSTLSEDCPFTMIELLERVKTMTRVDSELVVEVVKTPFEGDNKKIRWFRVQFVPISDPVTGENVVSVTEVDITNLKDVEAALKLKEVEQLEFFHHIVHELRTPLNGIINLVEDSISKVSSKGVKGYLKTALANSEQLLVLVNDIMDAATVARSGLVVAKERVEVNRVVKQCVAIMRPQVIGPKKLIDHVNMRSARKFYVTGDATRLQQVLTNLVANAVKFTKSGSITLTAEDCDAEAQRRGEEVLPEKKGMILISVTDTGQGIPKNKISGIFKDFNRGDDNRVRSIVGTGLGLSLCKKLVTALGGRFFVESEVNAGSTFAFTVPRNEDARLRSPRSSVSSGFGSPYYKEIDSGLSGGDQRSSDEDGDGVSTRGGGGRGRSGSDVSTGIAARDREIATLKRKLKEERAKVAAYKLRAEAAAIANASKQNSTTSNGSGDSDESASQAVNRGSALGSPLAQPSPAPSGLVSHSDVAGKIEILSVDDNPTNQLVVENIASSLGFVATACMDGQSAINLLESRDYLPDLVLLDVMMPGMSGHEVCQILREKYKTSMLPIIMVSAKVTKEEIVRGLEVGANDYVTKPFNRKELIARIETQLRLKNLWRVELEARRSNELLQELLPPHIIRRLKKGERLIADKHKKVTILFSDIVSFTTLAHKLDTIEIVELLNNMFTRFDARTDELGVYKVETIGDAYMVVAGHDEDSLEDHALRVYRFAEYMLEACKSVLIPGGREHMGTKHVQIRIGIHSGPAYSGVVGEKMPRYCFFGDTVNTASRMESHGFPMAIHVSDTTHALIKDVVQFHDFGTRTIKGKGRMRTYIAEAGNYLEALSRRDEQAEAAAAAASPPPPGTGKTGTADTNALQLPSPVVAGSSKQQQEVALEDGRAASTSPDASLAKTVDAEERRAHSKVPHGGHQVNDEALHKAGVVEPIRNVASSCGDLTPSKSLENVDLWDYANSLQHMNSAATEPGTRDPPEWNPLSADSHHKQLQKMQTVLASTRNRLSNCVAETTVLKTDNDELQQRLKVLQGKHDGLSVTNTILEKRNKQLQAELADSQEAHREQARNWVSEMEELRSRLRVAESCHQPPATRSHALVVSDSSGEVADMGYSRGSANRTEPPLASFLRGIGVEKYYHAFEREEIGMELLPLLTDSQLRAIGVMSMGARLAIRKAAKQLDVSF